MRDFWEGKRVLVTGGSGFVGSHLTEMLVARGAKVTVPLMSAEMPMKFLSHVREKINVAVANLMNIDDALRVTAKHEVVMNLAARVGGIEFNIQNPGLSFYENTQMFLNVLEASRINTVERFLVTSSACVYPRNCTIPTPETEGFLDMPDPANDGYGYAKRVQEFLAQKYAQQYGMKIAIARPYNAYGPRDSFRSSTSHVIPALIRRIFEAPEGGTIEVWGNGQQSRAFLFVEDFARGLMEITEKYAVADVLNLGTDEETKISDLVAMIIKLSGKNLDVHFDTTKPTGQPRRNCDTRKAKEKIGYISQITLEQGLKRTMDWYREFVLPEHSSETTRA